MKELKLALATVMPVSEDTGEGQGPEKLMKYMREAAEHEADLMVFPECSLTGYEPGRATELAIDPDDSKAEMIRSLSDELDLGVCFGYMERSGNSLYITQELYSKGSLTRYRKTHLGSSEKEVFTEGDSFPTGCIYVKGDPVKIGMQLCWESHIPEISSAYRKDGAELLIVPYASGMSGEKCRENWSVHLPARASDNGCFLAACNLLMNRDGIRGGGAAVWDPKGRMIAGEFSMDESIIFADIGGPLPRDKYVEERTGCRKPDMHEISYFDKVRRDLF